MEVRDRPDIGGEQAPSVSAGRIPFVTFAQAGQGRELGGFGLGAKLETSSLQL